jgi:hypothetical protein
MSESNFQPYVLVLHWHGENLFFGKVPTRGFQSEYISHGTRGLDLDPVTGQEEYIQGVMTLEPHIGCYNLPKL